MQLTMNIARFDPQTDTGMCFREYTVQWEQHETVLDLLLKAWHQDPSLAFRRSCRSSICGSCAMFIQDRSRLACQTLVRDLACDGGRLIIKPLPGFRQLKDLVVDLEPFFEALKQVLPRVLTVTHHDGHVSPEASRRIEAPATCILCGICDADIRESGNVTPTGLVKTLRLAVDPRDALGMHRLKIAGLTEEGLRSFQEVLVSVCPKGIELPQVALE